MYEEYTIPYNYSGVYDVVQTHPHSQEMTVVSCTNNAKHTAVWQWQLTDKWRDKGDENIGSTSFCSLRTERWIWLYIAKVNKISNKIKYDLRYRYTYNMISWASGWRWNVISCLVMSLRSEHVAWKNFANNFSSSWRVAAIVRHFADMQTISANGRRLWILLWRRLLSTEDAGGE